jgi:hypothetical protein
VTNDGDGMGKMGRRKTVSSFRGSLSVRFPLGGELEIVANFEDRRVPLRVAMTKG